MLAGQAEKHYEDRADELARAYGARRCAVRVHKSGQVWLDFYHADALAETIPALPIPRKPNPAAVVVGRIEAGQPWLIRLRDTHLFIAGATGPGKAALLWAIVRGLANGIRCRTVSQWGIDPRAAWS